MTAVPGEATLLLDSVDIADLTECVEGPVTWPYGGFTARGAFPQFPGVDGAQYVNQPYDTAVLPVQVTLKTPACSGYSGLALRDALEDLRLACKPDQPLTLRRLWSDGRYEDAAGKFLNITPARPIKNVMSCLVEFTLLELWYGPPVTGISAGTPTILGTTRTRRITVTLDPGPARTIANGSGNGYYFQYLTTVSAGGVLVDVEARTATLISGGADVSGFLRWPKGDLLQLDPGPQILAADAGTFSLTYRPAYL